MGEEPEEGSTEWWRNHKEYSKQQKRERLDRASEILRGEFVKLNEWHWRKTLGNWTLDYWPSTGRYVFWQDTPFGPRRMPANFAEPDLMLEKIREYRRKRRGTS